MGTPQFLQSGGCLGCQGSAGFHAVDLCCQPREHGGGIARAGAYLKNLGMGVERQRLGHEGDKIRLRDGSIFVDRDGRIFPFDRNGNEKVRPFAEEALMHAFANGPPERAEDGWLLASAGTQWALASFAGGSGLTPE